jgi:hypothetical protein
MVVGAASCVMSPNGGCKGFLFQLTYLDLYLIHFPISLRFVPFEVRYPPEVTALVFVCFPNVCFEVLLSFVLLFFLCNPRLFSCNKCHVVMQHRGQTNLTN